MFMVRKLTIKRVALTDTYTIGHLFIDGSPTKFCDTLEDRVVDKNKNGYFDGPEKKVYGQSAIPYGSYRTIMYHSPKFSPRYGGRKVPWLQNVPHFEGILIHSGNTIDDTLGCILVGVNSVKGKVVNSKQTLLNLLDIIGDTKEFEVEII